MDGGTRGQCRLNVHALYNLCVFECMQVIVNVEMDCACFWCRFMRLFLRRVVRDVCCFQVVSVGGFIMEGVDGASFSLEAGVVGGSGDDHVLFLAMD